MPTITRKVRYAPCGDCGEYILRDEMYSVNIKCFDPQDRETKLRIRLCEGCRNELFDDLAECEWDDSQMIERDVDVSESAIAS